MMTPPRRGDSLESTLTLRVGETDPAKTGLDPSTSPQLRRWGGHDASGVEGMEEGVLQAVERGRVVL
eukprot:761706-Hanusia_phi.AAC.2